MRRYCMQSAFLGQGWARNVTVSVSDDGFITDMRIGAADERTLPADVLAADAEQIDGIVVPGMPNAHSHAFQRAMAGNTEYRLSARDSFWTWRSAMYALANRIEPDDLQTLATQLFVEMLKSGYTSVAEFHYLHRNLSGAAYSGSNPLWEAIDNAADIAGIGLTFLPTLYQTSDFGGRPLKPEQSRFASDTEGFLRAVEELVASERRVQGVHNGPRPRRIGAAFHSLRAVPLHTLREAALRLREIDAGMPVHIHVAEQALAAIAKTAKWETAQWVMPNGKESGLKIF